MIVVLSSDSPPRLIDADRLDRLHAEFAGPLSAAMFDDLCSAGPDDEHVWLDVDRLRQAGATQGSDAEYSTKFAAMIAYAGSKGWLSDDHTKVRAHLEIVS